MLSSQAGSAINEFTQQWIRRTIGSFEMPSSWLLSLKPTLVAVFAAQFLGLWYLVDAVGGAVGGQAARHKKPLGMGWYFLASGLGAVLIGLAIVLLLPRLRPLFASSGPA